MYLHFGMLDVVEVGVDVVNRRGVQFPCRVVIANFKLAHLSRSKLNAAHSAHDNFTQHHERQTIP